jgi:hypothetical protein
MDNTFKLKLEYKVPIEQSDISYFVIDTKKYRPRAMSGEEYDKLKSSLVDNAKEQVKDKFGAKFSELNGNSKFREDQINYFIVGLFDPELIDDEFTSQLKRMKAVSNSRVNLAPVYEVKNSSQISQKIMKLDAELEVNTIYQDNVVQYGDNEYLTVSEIDIADNMVCETFRVKYKAIKLNDKKSLTKLEEARQEAWADVQKMQAIYTKYKLWHRSPIDGAFMFLTQHGWLTTATRTPKNNVKWEDMTLMLDFDEKNDAVTYVGDRLPSSDLPEFMVLVERNEQALKQAGEKLPVIKYMAHFHKNEITRNPKFKDYAVPFSRYGVFESGHKFADELVKGKAAAGINISGKGRGFIILEHDLVRMGVKLKHLEDFLKQFGLDKD